MKDLILCLTLLQIKILNWIYIIKNLRFNTLITQMKYLMLFIMKDYKFMDVVNYIYLILLILTNLFSA